MPVYADVLFVTNGFVNYLMLLCTMRFLNFKTGRVRLLLGSIVGSIFSLKIFLPPFPFWAEILSRLFISITIVLISFKLISVITFIKSFTAFFTVNFLFSGIIIALIYLFNPTNLYYDNGVIYYNISFTLLFILSTISFTIIQIADKVLSRKTKSQNIYHVTVTYNNSSISGRGLVDTGNCLKETFSGAPVIIADYTYIKSIVPESITSYLNNNNLQFRQPIRMIPVSTVNGSGLLPAFKADMVIIKGVNKTFSNSNIYIAVSKERFCHGEFEFILNADITEDTYYEKNDSFFKRKTDKIKA